jgi:serine/threonine protein kinase
MVTILCRDIKPSNILLDRAWKVKVCDFGLATSQKSGAGTPNYMAPELLQEASYTDKVDVYAFGVLLNELLARTSPFAGLDPARVTDLVVSGQRPDLASKAPAALLDIVAACWHADPNQRPDFKQAQELLAAVQLT